MKKFLLFLFGVAVCLVPGVVKADMLMGDYVPKEKTKNAGDCIFFKGWENNPQYSFFVEMVSKTKDYEYDYRQYIEPIKDDVCYKLYPGLIINDWWRGALPGTFFVQVRMVDKKFINSGVYNNIANINLNDSTERSVRGDVYGRWFVTASNSSENYGPVWQSVDVVSYAYSPNGSSWGGDFFAGVPFFAIKKDSNIKTISPVIIFHSASTPASAIYAEVADEDFNRTVLAVSPDEAAVLSLRGKDEQGRELLAIGFKPDQEYKISFDKQYGVTFVDGSKKTYNQSDFDKLLVLHRPEYNYVTDETSPKYNNNVGLWSIVNAVGFVVLLLSLTIIIESIVFYFFGSRRKRNYLWLVLANVISYPIGFFSVAVLGDKLDQFGLLPHSDIGVKLFILFWVELLVFFIECFIMWLGLRKLYTKKQIFLFVFVANLITALIGLVISLNL